MLIAEGMAMMYDYMGISLKIIWNLEINPQIALGSHMISQGYLIKQNFRINSFWQPYSRMMGYS